MDTGETILWRFRDRDRELLCIMRTCCAGAELQLRARTSDQDETVAVRELYPSKSDLYERARQLERHYAGSPESAA